ncbi:MAG: hypothetical protein HC834_03850 [Rhodospirillales bacterium]|nr:hypothetical protein [Rhodospirillales bacterium]
MSLPVAWHHPLWDLASSSLGWTIPGTVSLNPYDTMSTLARLLGYGGIFWLAFQYGQRSHRARRAIVVLTYAGVIYALYGIVLYFLDLEIILFFRKSAYFDDLTSVFVNRNSYATFAGLGLVCATGLIAVAVTTVASAQTSVISGVLRLVEAIGARGWPLILGWLALLLALILSHSRAGLVSAMIGIVTFLFAAGMTRAVDRRLALAMGAGCGCSWRCSSS